MNRAIFILISGIILSILSCKTSRPDEKIDHIILVINDLEKGMTQFETLTGVRPVVGGVHPNSFTQNALVALDKQAYIEILAPRTDVDSIPDWIMQFEELTPGGWAATSQSVDNTRKKLVALGFQVTEPSSGSRAKPDGTMLSWTTFGFQDKDTSVYPFFIQWGDGVVHPSESSPSGCSLTMLKLFSNDSDHLRKLNDHLKLGLVIDDDQNNFLQIQLNTPKGIVSFPSGSH